MLDGMLGRGGFSSKCKSLIKLTRTRIDVIRRKRNATQKFLKKDIADLLANGLENNAFGRAEGLIAELILTSCYDFIDHVCEIILKHLSAMQKHGDCPEDCREAVASLMFAAARFSDLPELRDLRDTFQERYGNTLEYYVNQKLVEHICPNPPDMEKKLRLLRGIASEFSVKWDPCAFERRMINNAAAREDKPKSHAYLHAATEKKNLVAKPKGNIHKIDNDVPMAKTGIEVSHQMKGREVLNNEHHAQSGSESIVRKQHSSELFYAREFEIDRHKSPVGPKAVQNSSTQENGRVGSVDAASSSRAEGAEPLHSQHKISFNGRQKVIPETEHQVQKPKKSNMPPPYVKPKKSKHKSRHLESHATGDDKDTLTFNPGAQNLEPEDIPHYTAEYYKDDTCGADPAPRRRSRRRHHKSSSTPGDEEERMIDKLLLHYSKKPSTGEKSKPSRKGKTGAEMDRDLLQAPSRSTSLPHEPSSSEFKKVFTRAASFDQEASTAAKHVHPKLPDYDDLAARFAALRRNKG